MVVDNGYEKVSQKPSCRLVNVNSILNPTTISKTYGVLNLVPEKPSRMRLRKLDDQK